LGGSRKHSYRRYQRRSQIMLLIITSPTAFFG
jgi:hypothetical protein